MLPDWVSNPGPLTYESGALGVCMGRGGRGGGGGGGGLRRRGSTDADPDQLFEFTFCTQLIKHFRMQLQVCVTIAVNLSKESDITQKDVFTYISAMKNNQFNKRALRP